MKLFKTLFCALAVSVSCVVANAQTVTEYEEAPYWFAGLKGGIQETPTNYSFSKLIAPAAGLYVGYQFVPQFGMRLDLEGMWNKTGFKPSNTTESFNTLTADIDLLFNITRMIWKNPVVDFSLVLGGGYNYSWNRGDAAKHEYAERMTGVTKSMSSPNFRGGFMVGKKLNRNWAVNLEVDDNVLRHDYNLKNNCNFDHQLTAMVGVTYMWGHKKVAKPEPVREEPAPAPVIVKEEPAPAPVVYKTLEEIRIEVFYDRDDAKIRPSEDAKLRGLSDFIKSHEVGTVIVSGYADVQTGNPAYNQTLSETRAAGIVSLLTDSYGIPASRISSKGYGDTVQPFSENDLNRVVIIEVKEAE